MGRGSKRLRFTNPAIRPPVVRIPVPKATSSRESWDWTDLVPQYSAVTGITPRMAEIIFQKFLRH